MKRFTAITSAIIIGASAITMSGCGSTNTNTDIEQNNLNDTGSLNIVCTVFPAYDWVTQLLGENAENANITYLLDDGVDMHSYQPTADDMIKISESDLFIYVGGESDEWVNDAIKEAVNSDIQIINMMEVLGDSVKEEEIVEGMEAEEHEEESEETEKDIEYDEHVWLSLTNAQTICSEIEKKLEIIDSKNTEIYNSNLTEYNAELESLNSEFVELFDSWEEKTILFGDRFPFRYFTDAYDLEYYAAFAGCSAETEASFETIIFLADKVDELSLNTVFTIENSDGKIAQTIIDNTTNKDAQIKVLNSMQSVTAKEGVTYLSIMNDNLETLKSVN
ncbi:MAG: metal ABC transporter substrate-binding protein [Butyrivibrio sp.]|nr:metal ABC transporter substrate-binding protein [Butyrivibrio sp.]